MIIVATLGIEEKFIMREIFRRGASEPLLIYLLTPQVSSEKVERTWIMLRDTLPMLNPNIKVERVRIDLEKPILAIAQLRNAFKSAKEELVFNLSGGERLLIFCVLAAISSLSLKCKIIIELEDWREHYELPSDVLFHYNFDKKERLVLELLKERPRTIKELLAETKLPRVTLWRKLKRLKELGLIEWREKKKYYVLTVLGLAKI